MMFLEFMISKFFFVIPMLFGGLAFWWLLIFMSMSGGIEWSKVRDEIEKGNVAMALYFGLRVLAVGIAVGLFVSAGARL